MKNDYTKDIGGFEDIESIVDKPGFEAYSTKKVKVWKKEVAKHTSDGDYKILEEYGKLSEDKFAPMFAKIAWHGFVRYDIRRWKMDNTPGKGVVYTYDELVELSLALDTFNFNENYSRVIYEYDTSNTPAYIYYNIAILSTTIEKDVEWNKEVNVMDWGTGKKIDLRKWTKNHEKCGKGICISFEELKVLKELVKKIL